MERNRQWKVVLHKPLIDNYVLHLSYDLLKIHLVLLNDQALIQRDT